MAKCKQCEDGSVECGPVADELCRPGGGWVFAGIYALKLFVRKGASGKCKVKVVPCLPEGDFECRDVTCPPPVMLLAKKAVRRKTGKAAARPARKTPRKKAK